MQSVTVVVPYRPSEQRQRVWEWVQGRYAKHLPHIQLLEGPLPEGPWIKALSVRRALDCVDADTVVIADADCWCDGLPEAIEAVEQGASWAIPHWQVHRLTEQGTEAVLRGAQPRSQPLEQRPYRGVPGGGFVVARREVLLSCPPDCRFVGWG